MSVRIEPYRSGHRELWNSFAAQAKNGHFLFDRNYMEYHSDRFQDASVLAFCDNDLVAILPANRDGNVVYSHQGLTFGGLVLGRDLTSTPLAVSVLTEIAQYCRATGAQRLVYKALPHIYHVSPAEEDIYALFRLGAKLTRVDVTTTIDLRARGQVKERRKRGTKRALKAGVSLSESDQWEAYWIVLADRLRQRHDVDAVHSIAEIRLLASRFPDRIRLFTATLDGDVVAGVVIYLTNQVAHAQYIGASDQGLKCGALDALFEYVISTFQETCRYFDFGISTEDQGRVLNEGLIIQKEGFGGSGIIHAVYTLPLDPSALP